MSGDTVSVYCPECGRLIALPAEKVGRMIECARCDTQFVAEEADDRPARRGHGADASSRAEVHIHQSGGFNHTPHVILTLFTCGLWLPIWLLIWACSGK